MKETGQWQDGVSTTPHLSPQQSAVADPELRLPKNKSTGNLLLQPEYNVEKGRLRFSFDAGTPQEMHDLARAAFSDHENGFGTSGLRRIRRQPPLSRTSTQPSSPSAAFIPPPLSYSNTLPSSTSSSRSVSAHAVAGAPASLGLEDLHRFPAESLHSFSFAHQSEDLLHNRQKVLRKTIDFMRERLGWAAGNPGLINASARVSGDSDIQSMMELLARAKILSIDSARDNHQSSGLGPLTGPADVDGANIFEKSFSLEAVVQAREGMGEQYPHPNHTDLCFEPREGTNSPGLDEEESLGNLEGSTRSKLKRTYTDISSISLQAKLMEALARPFSADEEAPAFSLLAPYTTTVANSATAGTQSGLHSHSSKWAPAAQAVFRTEAKAPWTILAANDLACLVFGVTRSEVRRLGILEVVQEDRRRWLEDKLRGPGPDPEEKARAAAEQAITKGQKSLVGARSGITAMLLNKAPARDKAFRAQTDDGVGGYYKQKTPKNHPATKSRGVLLCGDVVPIQKRNGTVGSASFWVMEKRGGLIWVLEEIIENVAFLKLDAAGCVLEAKGDLEAIWAQERINAGTSISTLFPRLSAKSGVITDGEIAKLSHVRYYAARTAAGINVPTSTTRLSGSRDLRISSFPHIAGMMVLSPSTLTISSSNVVFSAALFGYELPDGLPITDLIPGFDDLLNVLTREDNVNLVDGIVIPEHSFRRARALLALRKDRAEAASIFLRPSGLLAKHRDGSSIMVDVQMRVVKSESAHKVTESAIEEQEEEDIGGQNFAMAEAVYALWITYSRQLHSPGGGTPRPDHPFISRPVSPPNQPAPTNMLSASPEPALSVGSSRSANSSENSVLTQKLQEASSTSISNEPLEHPPPNLASNAKEPPRKKTINDFVILEEMGSGAYGQVKLARYKRSNLRKMVLKYVTKRRILVDTWTRDRRLGTVPLEIHVMDYLRRDGLRHPNVVEMVDFFEDDINYYIEMLPHGIPGMDLFDYIELRSNMEEGECRNIFQQVVEAIYHLHTKALVVHRDIKDENVVLNGEGKIKLIDFGSAAYIKNGPFDVFVGTIDYAAPEVLQGKSYRGKEQDVWALGILLYTIVYKENPFYSVDEILDHPLRIPFLPFSDACIDLVRKMLDRDVDERITITEVKEHPWMLES